MSKFFSINTGGFYAPEFRGDYDAAGTWPSDGVEVDGATETIIRAVLARGDTITRCSGTWQFIAQIPTQPEVFAALRFAARSALDKSDVTIIRCAENNAPIPVAWATYRHALRAIVGGGHADALPMQPPYPAES